MFNISKFLEKFSKEIQSGEAQNKKIIDVIKTQTGIDLDPKDLEIKNNIVYINSSPAVKNKIFIYKEDILRDVSSDSTLNISDIR